MGEYQIGSVVYIYTHLSSFTWTFTEGLRINSQEWLQQPKKKNGLLTKPSSTVSPYTSSHLREVIKTSYSWREGQALGEWVWPWRKKEEGSKRGGQGPCRQEWGISPGTFLSSVPHLCIYPLSPLSILILKEMPSETLGSGSKLSRLWRTNGQ